MPNLRKIWRRLKSTVWRDRDIRSAPWALRRPSDTISATARSVSVRLAQPDTGRSARRPCRHRTPIARSRERTRAASRSAPRSSEPPPAPLGPPPHPGASQPRPAPPRPPLGTELLEAAHGAFEQLPPLRALTGVQQEHP